MKIHSYDAVRMVHGMKTESKQELKGYLLRAVDVLTDGGVVDAIPAGAVNALVCALAVGVTGSGTTASAILKRREKSTDADALAAWGVLVLWALPKLDATAMAAILDYLDKRLGVA
jgi:hypothetical protein